MDPTKIPALDITINQLFQGQDLVGALVAENSSDRQGHRASIRWIWASRAFCLQGSGGWEGTPGSSSSWYKGRISGKNLADVLKGWGFAPSVTSEEFHMDVDGRWPGSPAWLATKRFSGTLDASLNKGQFVEVEGSAQALRVFGLLNFNSIGRRLRLDFSDLFGKGLSYDRVKGLLVATNGVYVTREPIRLTGPSSNIELNGTLNLVGDQIDAKLLVTLPVTNNLPIAALIVGAPAIGGALFLIDKLIGDRVARFASVKYTRQRAVERTENHLRQAFLRNHVPGAYGVAWPKRRNPSVGARLARELDLHTRCVRQTPSRASLAPTGMR